MLVVLVVDDDEMLLRASARVIGQTVVVLVARSLDQARELLCTTPRIDAAVIDYALGERCGLDLLVDLKALQRG